MKKCILIYMTFVTLTLAGCNNESDSTMETSTSASTDLLTEVSTELPIIESAAELVKETEYKTANIDFSFMGELVNDLLIVSNNESALKTRDEVFDYLKDKGYAFYPYNHADVDNTVTPEKAYEWGPFIIKPESVIQYGNDNKFSDVMFSFSDWTGVGERLECIQYILKDCTDETKANMREYFNKVIADGTFDNCEYEVTYNNDDAETWTYMIIQIKGTPINPEQTCDYYCKFSIYLDSTLLSIDIY